jgi:outer membrane protein
MKAFAPLVLVLVLPAAPALADAGDWTVRAGPYLVAPKSDNSDIVTVDDGVSLGFTVSYAFTDNWAFEVLAATPFSHDIKLVGGDKVAEVKHLPPTFSLQYHWNNETSFSPYVGFGLNYTTFFDESTTGALAGSDLSLDDSFGFAAQLGTDLALNERWSLNLDLRWVNIETDATLDGADAGKVEIDPFVAGLNLGYRF